MGAWIETSNLLPAKRNALVAPYVGAWIETNLVDSILAIASSHPTWVRGLKHVGLFDRADDVRRTPRGCVD